MMRVDPLMRGGIVLPDPPAVAGVRNCVVSTSMPWQHARCIPGQPLPPCEHIPTISKRGYIPSPMGPLHLDFKTEKVPLVASRQSRATRIPKVVQPPPAPAQKAPIASQSNQHNTFDNRDDSHVVSMAAATSQEAHTQSYASRWTGSTSSDSKAGHSSFDATDSTHHSTIVRQSSEHSSTFDETFKTQASAESSSHDVTQPHHAGSSFVSFQCCRNEVCVML